MVTILTFIVLGGGAYAATQLPKNSVGKKQIKNGATRLNANESVLVRGRPTSSFGELGLADGGLQIAWVGP